MDWDSLDHIEKMFLALPWPVHTVVWIVLGLALFSAFYAFATRSELESEYEERKRRMRKYTVSFRELTQQPLEIEAFDVDIIGAVKGVSAAYNFYLESAGTDDNGNALGGETVAMVPVEDVKYVTSKPVQSSS